MDSIRGVPETICPTFPPQEFAGGNGHWGPLIQYPNGSYAKNENGNAWCYCEFCGMLCEFREYQLSYAVSTTTLTAWHWPIKEWP